MKTARVSICIPTYNQTVLLEKTLDSLCLQTYRDFDVIVSDDSTHDDVKEFVKTYEDRLPVHYYKNERPLGSPANWNKLLDLAKGELIKFMHHDDWFTGPAALQDFVKAFDDVTLDLVFCNSQISSNSGGGEMTSYNIPSSRFLQRLRRDPDILFNDNRIGAPSAVMYRRNDLRFDERVKYVVDTDFYIRFLRAHRFLHLDQALVATTSDNPGQVSASSMNKETQVGEYIYLYNKIFRGGFPVLKWSRFFFWMFRVYKVSDLDELEKLAGEKPHPYWYFRLLIRLAKMNVKTT